jgi:hypothetical protein
MAARLPPGFKRADLPATRQVPAVMRTKLGIKSLPFSAYHVCHPNKAFGSWRRTRLRAYF